MGAGAAPWTLAAPHHRRVAAASAVAAASPPPPARALGAQPKLFCAQPLACSPICTAFLAENGLDDGKPTPAEWNAPVSTVAEGTSIARPVRLQETCARARAPPHPIRTHRDLVFQRRARRQPSPASPPPPHALRSPPRAAPRRCDALRRSGGGAVRVSEGAIKAATLELARAGLYVEPTCAQAAAAYHELLSSGAITAEQRTVVVLTGTGVKATPRVAEILGVSL